MAIGRMEFPGYQDIANIANNMTLNTNLSLSSTTAYTINNGSVTDPIGGSKYNIRLSGASKFDIGGNLSIEGNFSVSNNGEIILRGCDTLRIGGNTKFSNQTKLTIESCAVMIIEGNLNLSNEVQALVDGNIIVKGDYRSTNTSTISGTGFLQVDGMVQTTNSSTIFGSSMNCPSSCTYGNGTPLPISLTEFTAEFNENNQIEVKWTTLSEINNEYFTVEISNDAVNFSPIAKVNGAGNSSIKKNYSTALNPLYDGVNYLRLKQTDYDGKSETFKIVAVHPNTFYNLQTEIFPNPGNGKEVKISLHKPYVGAYRIEIIDVNGNYHDTKHIYIDSEYSTYSFRMFFNKPLSKGIYFIKIASDYTQEIKKYIVN